MEPNDNVNVYADVYKEIADELGPKAAVKIYNLFKGQQILFPKKLYKKEFVYAYIREHYNGENIRELAQAFDYSDRRIRQIVSNVQSMR